MFAYKGCVALAAAYLALSFFLLRDKLWRPETLRAELARTFAYEVSGDFPKHIWQTWKHLPHQDEFDEALLRPVSSWLAHNPEFKHEILTDEDASDFVARTFPLQVTEAYNALPRPVFKADFFRYLVLLARGGIYSDIDTTALKPSAEWISTESQRLYGLVVGIEADPNRTDWKDWYSRRVQFCQWTIMSKPGHPVLVDIVTTITQETLRRKAHNELELLAVSHRSVLETTGPALWTDTLFDYFNNARDVDRAQVDDQEITWERFADLKEPTVVNDVVVLPITSFSPGIGHMGAGSVYDPLAYVKHRFSGTWKPNGRQTQQQQALELESFDIE